MKNRSWKAIPLLLSLAIVPAAQSAGGAKQDADKPMPAKHAMKGKMEERAPLTIVLPVTGATPANAAKTLEGLRELKQATFRCEACDYSQATEGACPHCKKALAAGPPKPLIHKVKLSEDDHQLTLMMAPGHSADLAMIEASLARQDVKVDRKALTIPPYSRLILSGGDAEKAVELQKALTEAKLFEDVAVTFEEPSKRLYVTPKLGSATIAMGRFTEVLKRTDPSLHLENVEWCSPCAKCAEKGMLMEQCPACCPLLKT